MCTVSSGIFAFFVLRGVGLIWRRRRQHPRRRVDPVAAIYTKCYSVFVLCVDLSWKPHLFLEMDENRWKPMLWAQTSWVWASFLQFTTLKAARSWRNWPLFFKCTKWNNLWTKSDKKFILGKSMHFGKSHFGVKGNFFWAQNLVKIWPNLAKFGSNFFSFKSVK